MGLKDFPVTVITDQRLAAVTDIPLSSSSLVRLSLIAVYATFTTGYGQSDLHDSTKRDCRPILTKVLRRPSFFCSPKKRGVQTETHGFLGQYRVLQNLISFCHRQFASDSVRQTGRDRLQKMEHKERDERYLSKPVSHSLFLSVL